MSTAPTILHVTHEAVHHFGGIGTVLEGLLSSPAYRSRIGRSILLCPLWDVSPKRSPTDRLGDDDATVWWSSIDGIDTKGLGGALGRIEEAWGVRFVYGVRRWPTQAEPDRVAEAEVLLVDLADIHMERLNEVKAALWERTGFESKRYEHDHDFEQWCRLAGPALDAVVALTREDEPTVVLSHEYMGMPTALLAAGDERRDFRTILHAHECATARPIVERHPAHDAAFYPAMRAAMDEGLSVGDVFGDQEHFYRHALVERAHHLDLTIAVGEATREEMRFLSPAMRDSPVRVVPNGVPSGRVGADRRREGRERVFEWLDNVLGWRPDFLFTHVTRPVISKGLWRDIALCAHLEHGLLQRREKGVYLLLTCGGAPRSYQDVSRMAEGYGWPHRHREGWPDLSGPEVHLSRDIRSFNAMGVGSVRGLLVNQWGFTREALGPAAPEGLSIADLRCAADAEFGLSTYEPFGISPLEPLHAGAIGVVSSISGCADVAREAMRDIGVDPDEAPNLLVADFTQSDTHDPVGLSRSELHAIEERVLSQLAIALAERLPRTDAERARLLEIGGALAERMGWDRVVEDHFLPAVESVLRSPARQPAAAS